jgi:HNH endonuclease
LLFKVIDLISNSLGIPQSEIRAIEGFSGYFVSSHGQVVSTKGKQPKVLHPWPTNYGHLKVSLFQHGKREDFYLHQLVLMHFAGERPSPSSISRHKDGDEKHNDISNLEWATPSENAADRWRHKHNDGRSLADEQVQAIRELGKRIGGAVSDELTFELLARLYDVHPRYIADIVKGRTRKKVEPLQIPNGGILVIALPNWTPKRY